MGLDMYAVRIRKPSDDEIKKIEESKETPDDFISVLAEDIDSDAFKDLKKYAKKVAVVTQYINMKKIREDNHIDDEAHIVCECLSAEGVKWTFGANGRHQDVSLTQKEIEENYIIEEPEERFVVHCEPIGYWRKEYKLQDKLYDLYPGTIDNLGYHKCTPEMIDAMKEYAYDDEPYVGLNDKINDDDIIFYHEWY